MSEKDKVKRELIEENGKIFEKFDLTPMQGRIMAYFTLSDTPDATFEALVGYFKASKSSVSNSLNYLLENRMIDYKTYSADRKRHFFLTDSFFRVYFEKVLANVTELREFAYNTVSMRSPEHPSINERILRWIENANRFQESLESTLDSLKKDQGGRQLL